MNLFALLFLSLVSFVYCINTKPVRPHHKILKSQTFSWDQCGGSDATLSSLTVTPDPIKLGANISVLANAAIEKTGTSSNLTSLALHIDTKVLGVWVEVPCLDGFGSCTYDDPCSLLDKLHNSLCPVLQPKGIPCACPLTPGSYSTGSSGISIFLQDPHLSWLTDGDFYIKATLTSGSNLYFCLELYISITN
eukprot:TRINITY_DN302_c0_g1_i14.p1 TRINITY_DN302_c0_g1~~TRINITY_DN302_c0_g1_i14.p1  ORF type:complete len:192 (-),score=35.45 TRINITY_DN302_c0_g1_i14:10-585(-)